MAEASQPGLLFRRSSRCTGGGCVEVALPPGGGAVVRHSADCISQPLTVNKREWLRFVSCVKNDEFDL
jgi:hypothetical protein